MTQIPSTRAPRPFTGWHMFAILVAFFALVYGVNFFMAYLAETTFSGEVVDNSYDASQVFNHWLDEAAKEKALGWSAHTAWQADGRLAVSVAGAGTRGAVASGEVWHPLGDATVHAISFAPTGAGSYVSTAPLGPGRWVLRLTLRAGGKQWHALATIR